MRNDQLPAQERELRIEEIGSYFEKTGKSTREIAKYFTENHYPISNKTVSKYIHEYMDKYSESSELIEEKIENNREKTYEDEEIKKQVLIEFGLLLKGYTIEEIALIQEKGSSSVQRDLTQRLQKLSEKYKDDPTYKEFYEKAQAILSEHQKSNSEDQRRK